MPATLKLFADFVALSVLEDVSYTRKDGQFLRWDLRAGRAAGKFDKGPVLAFDVAIARKLNCIQSDLLFYQPESTDGISHTLVNGSNFACLNQIDAGSVDLVITSPPYCNRYDYTRTYALELAYLGVDAAALKAFRQHLLSCTVEHKQKDFAGIIPEAVQREASRAIEDCSAFGDVMEFLNAEAEGRRLNNRGVVTMVNGYFREMAIHLAQMARVMRAGGLYYAVNDNVSYNGLVIPVDCILSEIAESLGFACEQIWTLGRGKGNSSQQMAQHGRHEMRKCVYKWRRR